MDRIGKYISHISRMQTIYVGKKLEHLGLSRGTYPILLGIDKNEEISQNSLARHIGVDKAMVARNVKKLIELGYIQKLPSPCNKSIHLLSFTDKGKTVMPEVVEVLDKWEEYLSGIVGDTYSFKCNLMNIEDSIKELLNK